MYELNTCTGTKQLANISTLKTKENKNAIHKLRQFEKQKKVIL